MIYAIILISSNGAYSVLPLVTSNYMYCILALKATFLEKRNAIMEVLLLKEVYTQNLKIYIYF